METRELGRKREGGKEREREVGSGHWRAAEISGAPRSFMRDYRERGGAGRNVGRGRRRGGGRRVIG